MKKLLLLLLTVFTVGLASAQVANDFRSAASGNWNTLATWQRYNGSTWAAATVLPGAAANNGNVTIQDGHTVTLTAAPTAAISSLTVGGGTSGAFTVGGFAITITGTTTIASGATITFNNATGTKTFTGDVTNNGTWNETAAAVITCAGTFTQNNSFTASTGVHTFSGATKTIGGSATTIAIPNATFTGTYTNNIPTFTVSTALAGAGTLTMGANTTLNLGGTSAITTLNCTTNTPNEVIYNNATTAQTIKGTTYYNLTVTKNTNIAATLGAATTVTNNLNVTSGVLADGGFQLTGNATGTWTMGANTIYRTTKTATNWIPTLFTSISLDASSTIDLAMTTATTFASGAFSQISNTFPNLSSSAGAVVKTLGAAITVSGNLTITTGTIADGGFQIAGGGTGTLTIANGATLTLGSTATATTFPSFATNTLGATSNVSYNSNQAQTISSTPVYGNLLTVATAAVTKTFDGNTTIVGTLTNGTNNTLNFDWVTVAIAGTTPLSNSGTINATNGGCVLKLNGTATQTLTFGGSYTSNILSNLEIDNSVGVSQSTFPATLVVTNFTINSGKLYNLNSITLNISDTYTNSGTITANSATATLNLVGSTSMNLNIGTYTGSVLGKLTVNKTGGATVSLTAPLNVSGTLTLTSGIVYTDATNILTITNTAAAGLSGGSTSSYIFGPLQRMFPASLVSGSTYTFPIGRTDYNPFEMINPTTTSAGTITVRAEVFDSNIGGTDGTAFSSSPSPNRYWITSKAGSGVFSSTGNIRLTDAVMTLTSANAVGFSTTGSVFNSLGGTVAGSTITTTSPANPALGYFKIGTKGCMSGTYTVGATGYDFTNMTDAVTTMNGALVCGDIIFELQTNYVSTGETYPIIINEASYSGGPWDVTFRPASGVSSNLTTSGSSATQIISLNGIDRLTLDGRPGGSGSTIRWVIANTSTSGQVIAFNNDATYNTLEYIQVEGVNTTTVGTATYTNSGLIAFGNTAPAVGNEYNTIEYCTIKDGATQPICGIYSLGNTTASRGNTNNVVANNNIYNIWAAGTGTYNIMIGIYNSAWKIRNNSIYQTASRASTGAGAHYGIYIDAATGSGIDFAITGNYIGGTAPLCASTAWTKTGTVGTTFVGIYSNSLGTALDTITNNTIKNISWTCTNVAIASAPGIFTGIYKALNGGAYIDNNTIGAATGTGSIVVTSGTSSATTFGIAHSTSTGNITITNNTVGAITVNGTTTSISANLVGISIGQGLSSGSRTVNGNTINNLTVNSSIITTAQYLRGIDVISGANNIDISTNIISNLNNAYASTGATGQVIGINAVFGVLNITSNQVYNLTTASQATGTAASATAIGIVASATSNSNNISNNKVYNITNTAASAAANVVGIAVSSSTSTAITSYVDANFIHSVSSSTSSTTATQTGLYIIGGNNNVTNNMIRLGIDASGSSLTQGKLTYGIWDSEVATSYSDFYFNSVYIGGTGVASGTVSSYAFYSLESAGVRAFRDNIFYNARSNASGTGKNYAFYTASATGLTCDYNDLYVSGTGGIVAAISTTDYATLALAPSTINGNSISSDPIFIAPTGNASAVDLHVSTVTATPIEGIGVNIGTVTLDYDGESRSSFTPEDMGADAANFIPIDQTAPTVSIGTVTAPCNGSTSLTFTATITDGSAVSTATGVRPRVYYKKTTDANDNTGWKYVQASNITSPFSFTVDFTLLNSGSVNPGDVLQYFVTAQDSGVNVFTPNVAISSGSFAATPSSVALTSGAFPIGGSPTTVTVLPCQGTVTVGTTGNYTSFTRADGIFNALNLATLTGNLTINVVSDITIEDGTVGLNQLTESGVGGYKVKVQSSAPGTPRDIASASGYAGALFRLNGADRITFYGGTGTARDLVFRNPNTSTSAATFQFINDATTDTLQNCVIEGAGTSLTQGTVWFSTTTGTTGNDNNVITGCDIRDLTTASATPNNAIYALGTTLKENSGNIITNCNIFNFYQSATVSSGILISTYNSAFTIDGNRLYQTASRAHNSDMYIIRVTNGTSGTTTITNNTIGYAASNGTGICTFTGSGNSRVTAIQSDGGTTSITNNNIQGFALSTNSGGLATPCAFTGVYLAAGNSTITGNTIGSTTSTGAATNITLTSYSSTLGLAYGVRSISAGTVNISNNNIGNITLTHFGGTTGIVFYGINATTGTNTISGNTIGSATLANSIQVTNSGGSNNAVSIQGIVDGAGSTMGTQTITNNIIANFTNPNVSANGATIASAGVGGISASGGGQYVITGNSIYNMTAANATSGTAALSAAYGIVLVTGNTSACSVSNNTIYNIAATSTGTTATQVVGISYNGGTSASNVVNNNVIHSLNNSSTSVTTPYGQIYGIQVASGSGIGTVANNIVRLGIDAAGSSVATNTYISGIEDVSTGAQNFYFNSVFVGGTVSSGAVNSFAFRRTATSGADKILNNIFANDRSGGTGLHFAFASANLTSLVTAAAFDYNIYYAKNNTEFSIATTPANLSAAATTNLRLQALRANTTIGHNLHSGVANLSQLNFSNATGDASSVSLNLGASNCAVGAGIAVSGYGVDYLNNTRAAAPAIGAHENGFSPMIADNDIYTPNFSFTNVPPQGACGGPGTVTVDVTITDIGASGSRIPTTGSNVPNMWWRLSTGSWASVAGTLQSGDEANGVWRFTISPTLSTGQTYQYYFVAEDQATNQALTSPGANRWFTSFDATTPAHSSVSVQTTPPNTGIYSTFATNTATPITGTVYVGGTINTGNGEVLGTNFFNTLTGGTTNDLFFALNGAGMSGDLTVLIRSNLTEAGTTGLNQVTEYCSTGSKIKIQPETASLKTISGSLAGQGLVTLNGADRVTIDGRYNATGTTRYLKFANTYSSTGGSENSTLKFITGATNDTVRYCDIEGSSAKAAGGAVHFSSTSSDIVIEESLIHGNSSNWIVNCVLADLGASNITIRNNEIYNFLAWSGGNTTRAYGIRVNSGNGSNWTITGNSIYNTGINGQSVQTAIGFQPGSASTNNVISNNWIGGSSAQCGTGGSVTYWGNTVAVNENQLQGIYVNCGTITLDANNISNIYLNYSDYSGFVGMYFAGSTVPTVTNNVFGTGTGGTPDGTKIIQVTGGGLSLGSYPGYIYGIWNASTSTSMATYTNNDFYYLFQSGAYQGGNVHCISHQSAGPATITGNRINGPQASGIGFNSFGIRVEPTASTSGNIISGNNIAGPYINSLVAGGVNNNAIYVKVLGTQTVSGTIEKNIVWDMRSADRAGNTEGIYIWTSTGGNGNWDIKNNMITLRNNNSTANCIGLYGIDIELNSSSTTNLYNNTVLIGGSNGGTAATGIDFSSYAYFRYPNASGSVTGDVVNMRNNIFINTREVYNGNVTGHFAIGNVGSSNYATNWSGSNYNFLATGLSAKSYIGQWGTTTQAAISNWRTASSSDANSWSVATITSGSSTATALNPADLFTNTLSDLSIKTDNQAAWFVNGKGVAGSQVSSLADDIGGASRSTTYGYGMDIGADEFTASVAPYTLTQTVTGVSTTNTFTFAGRTIGSVNWQASGSAPSTVSMTYYSGNDPGSVGAAYLATNKTNFVYEITASGGSGYNYVANLNYDPALLGTYAGSESSTRLVKTSPSLNWFDQHASINTTTKVITSVNTLNSFSWFTGGEANEPLPISLISFTATPVNNDHVDLGWVTASETNNDYFTVERSRNAVDFEPVAVVDGAGNSNTMLTYDAVDEQPYAGLSYYRLKQTDFDGQFAYSNLVPVMFNSAEFAVVNAFTNTNGQFEVWVNAPSSEQTSYTILDMQGKIIGTVNQEATKGLSKIVLPTDGLAAGVYFIRIQGNTHNTSVKLFKQ